MKTIIKKPHYKMRCPKCGCPYFATNKCFYASQCHIQFRLTKAPQSWCYIEGMI